MRSLPQGIALLALSVLIGGCGTPSPAAGSSRRPTDSEPLAIQCAASASASMSASGRGGGATNEVNMRLETCIQRRWIHSHEEDTDAVSVYRPSNYTFPPSRGRIGFEFRPGGELIYLGIAPTDGTAQATGRWAIEGGQVIRIEALSGPMRSMVITVLSCDDDKLIVKR